MLEPLDEDFAPIGDTPPDAVELLCGICWTPTSVSTWFATRTDAHPRGRRTTGLHQHHCCRRTALWRREEKCARLTRQLEEVLGALDVLSLELTGRCDLWPDPRATGAARQTIGGNDLLIAAQEVALGYTMVTDNVAEFRRVGGLPCENWLRSA